MLHIMIIMYNKSENKEENILMRGINHILDKYFGFNYGYYKRNIIQILYII